MSETISFIINEDQLARVDAQAAVEDRNRSSMLRRLIDAGFDALSQQPPAVRISGAVSLDSSGVVPMVCANCGKVFGVINAEAAQADHDLGIMRFCKDCLAMPEEELVASLEAKLEMEVA